MYFPEVFLKQIFLSLNTGLDVWRVVLAPGLSAKIHFLDLGLNSAEMKIRLCFSRNLSNAEFGMVSSRKSKLICRPVVYVRTYFLQYL